MNWLSILLIASCWVHAFAAPQVLAEGENGVGADMYSTSYRDEDSVYTKLRDSNIQVTPQGRKVDFDTTRKVTGEDSGESASTEDSDESLAPTKRSERGSEESESASTEDSDEYPSSQGGRPEKHAVDSNNNEESIVPREGSVPIEPAPTSEVAEVTSAKPAAEVTPVEIVITAKPKPSKPPKKPKPARVTTATPLAVEGASTPIAPTSSPVSTTEAPTRRYPCKCGGGLCSCCTGLILENFNVPIRSHACANVTYEPDDFAFNFKLSYNDRVLYNNRMSAKNPRPACIPINRYFGVKMCARLSNVYMSGRNVHACLDLEGFWDEESAFQYSFNCFRIGTSGVALVRPEDGGGLPPPPDEEQQTNEDYDDSARGWTGDVQPVAI